MNIFDKLEIKTKDWVSCIGDDYDQTIWVAGPKCTRDQWDAAKTALAAEYNAQAYARSRKVEYDALNQLEMQFDDKVHGTTTWEDAILAIKAKYPKPE